MAVETVGLSALIAKNLTVLWAVIVGLFVGFIRAITVVNQVKRNTADIAKLAELVESQRLDHSARVARLHEKIDQTNSSLAELPMKVASLLKS